LEKAKIHSRGGNSEKKSRKMVVVKRGISTDSGRRGIAAREKCGEVSRYQGKHMGRN